ncbi:hypothetical protein GSF22_33425, partial [Micromonospora echinofusca]|nr:hypothetical protein [Micromonospora echinofusca]
MSKKFLGRVIAGAALGGAALFGVPTVAAAAQADGPPQADGRQHERGAHQHGHLRTWPVTVSPGQRAKLFMICHTPQRHPWAWSSVTGRLRLKPLQPPAPPTDGPTSPPAPTTSPPAQPPASPTDGPVVRWLV